MRLHQRNIPNFRNSKLKAKPGLRLRLLFNLKHPSTTLKCLLLSRHPFHPSQSLTITPSLTHNPSLLSRLFLPPAVTRPCNQALGSIYTHRTGLLLLLFRGTLLVLRLVIMGLSLMLLCRGYSPEGVGESEIFSFSIFLYFFFSILNFGKSLSGADMEWIWIWIWIWVVTLCFWLMLDETMMNERFIYFYFFI